LRVVLFGYSSVGTAAFRACGELGFPVAAVITHEPPPDESVWFEPVADLARAAGVPVRAMGTRWSEGETGIHSLVAALRPDVILSAYCRAVLPPSLLAVPRLAALNLHGSLLPRYRGRAPLNWAILNGETETGMTLHHMIAEPDAGDIVLQRRIAIGPDETAPELQLRLDAAATSILLEALPHIAAGTAQRAPQDHALATRFGRRRPADGAFEWTWPARRIHDLVRAVTRPYPGAFTLHDGRRLNLWRTRVPGAWCGPRLAPGELWRSAPGATFAGTGDGVLELVDFDPAAQ
jgi:methionyl-tRNA formyltransferase